MAHGDGGPDDQAVVRRVRVDSDVGLLVDRLAEEKGREARVFFKRERYAERMKISRAEKKSLLEGWMRLKQRWDREQSGRILSRAVEAALESERDPDGEHERLAWTLLELQRRARRSRIDVVDRIKVCLRERRELLGEIDRLERKRLVSKEEVELEFAVKLDASGKELALINAQLEVLKQPLDRAQVRSVKELEERKKKFEKEKKTLKSQVAKRIRSVEKEIDEVMCSQRQKLEENEAKCEEYERLSEDIEAAFVKVAPWPRLHFECSMLQTAFEDAEGVLRWRDVVCADEDDFDGLWSREWLQMDFLAGDQILFLPEAMPMEIRKPGAALFVYAGTVLASEEVAGAGDVEMRTDDGSDGRQSVVGEVVGRKERRSFRKALEGLVGHKGRPDRRVGFAGQDMLSMGALHRIVFRPAKPVARSVKQNQVHVRRAFGNRGAWETERRPNVLAHMGSAFKGVGTF